MRDGGLFFARLGGEYDTEIELSVTAQRQFRSEARCAGRNPRPSHLRRGTRVRVGLRTPRESRRSSADGANTAARRASMAPARGPEEVEWVGRA